MARSWPRTVEVYVESLHAYVGLLAEERVALGDGVTVEAIMKAELNTAQKGLDEIANKLIDGMEAVIKIQSPYPPEYQEMVYQASRYSPGSGFGRLLTKEELDEIVQRLRRNGTL